MPINFFALSYGKEKAYLHTQILGASTIPEKCPWFLPWCHQKKPFEDSCASNRAPCRACWIHRMTGWPLVEMVFWLFFFSYKVSCKSRTCVYIAYNLPKKSGPPKWKWSRNRQPIPTLLRCMLHAYYELHNSTNNCYLHSWWTTVALVECLGASGKVRKSAA